MDVLGSNKFDTVSMCLSLFFLSWWEVLRCVCVVWSCFTTCFALSSTLL